MFKWTENFKMKMKEYFAEFRKICGISRALKNRPFLDDF